jgi:hypothetical protein
LKIDIPQSKLTSLLVQWNPLVGEETGDAPILTYNLQIQSGGLWTNVKGQQGSFDTATEFDVVGLTPDTYYSFRV